MGLGLGFLTLTLALALALTLTCRELGLRLGWCDLVLSIGHALENLLNLTRYRILYSTVTDT